MPCSVLGPFPSANSDDFTPPPPAPPPIKCFQVWRGSDLPLGIQTAALLRGEKQFSIPSTIGEGSGLLCVLIYSLSGQEESCSGSFASCCM